MTGKTFSENVAEFGLFTWTCMEMKRKRYSLPQSGRWDAPVRETAKRSPVAQPPEFLGKPVAVIPPKPLVVTSIDNVGDEVETFSEDDIVELVPSAPLPYEECLGDGVPSDGEVEQEEGGGQLDVVTADEE